MAEPLSASDGHKRRSVATGLFTLLLAAASLLLPVFETAPRSGAVGWLLLLAGGAELVFGSLRASKGVRRATMIAGLLTALAGLVFVFRPFADFFPVANVVMAWLLLRGVFLLVMAFRQEESRLGAWLALSGAADFLLGALLVVGLPIAALVVGLFGPTPELIASFSLILAVSFLVSGIAQIGLALAERRRGSAATL